MTASIADFLALPCRITERNSREVHVRVGVCSNEVKEAGAAVARIIADSSELCTACLRVANDQFDE